MAEKAAGPKAMIGGHKASLTGVDMVDTDADDKIKAPKRAKTKSDVMTAMGSGPFKEFFRKGLQDSADHALLLFITCNGIPPTVVNSPKFKNFVSVLNISYNPPSETTLSDKLIPNEAVNIQQATIQYLCTCRDLMITFDGGKLRS